MLPLISSFLIGQSKQSVILLECVSIDEFYTACVAAAQKELQF